MDPNPYKSPETGEDRPLNTKRWLMQGLTVTWVIFLACLALLVIAGCFVAYVVVPLADT